MTEAVQDVRPFVERLAQQSGAAVRLGEVLSLAARIEPWLLRAARLRLTPELDASAEADLWLSPLVESRTPDWIVLAPKAAHELGRRLAVEPSRLGEARELIVEAHRAMPPTIVLEDELLWLAHGAGEDGLVEINKKLEGALYKLVGDPEANIGIARWFAAAAWRLPPAVAKTESYSLLVFVTSALLGRYVSEPSARNLSDVEALSGMLPPETPKISVWAALTNKGLTLRPDEAEQFRQIDLPRTDPLLLEVKVGSWSPLIVTLRHDETKTIAVGLGPLRIRTAAGDVFSFVPRRGPSRRVPHPDEVMRELHGSLIDINENFKVYSVARTLEHRAGWQRETPQTFILSQQERFTL